MEKFEEAVASGEPDRADQTFSSARDQARIGQLLLYGGAHSGGFVRRVAQAIGS